MPAALPTPAAVQLALAGVLGRPEFRTHEAAGPLAWLAERYHALQAAFFSLVARLFALKVTAPTLFWLVVACLALAAVAILAHLVHTAMDVRRGRPRRSRRDRAEARAAAGTDWAGEAERAAEAGRFREAALALYQAMLLHLEALGAVRYHPAKTPGDYRREVRAHPLRARRFDAFLRGFEPVAFGSRAVDRSGFERLSAAAREVTSD
ncbi:MAG TPA: DUF4129 domain-containing protein [Longimicrobiaceae bacterium]|nr:DUF4129 domain-containing protein [Longimicrobiaceae bacterium]